MYFISILLNDGSIVHDVFNSLRYVFDKIEEYEGDFIKVLVTEVKE